MYTDEQYELKTTKTNNKKSSFNINIVIILLVICIVILASILLFKKSIPSKKNIVFELIGSDITLNYKEIYREPGFFCYDNNNSCNSLVEVTNGEIPTEPGDYTISYKYQDIILTRKVIVLEPRSYELVINYNIDNKNITKEDIHISYTISGETFEEVLLPDGTSSKELSGNITVSENGIYHIKAYNIRKEEFDKEIIIDNIDKEKPSGQCHAIVKNKNSQIEAKATDNDKVIKYEYYDNNKMIYSGDKSIYTTSSSTTNNIVVMIYDEAGNTNELKCSIKEEKYNEPIKPSSSDNVIFKTETDTFNAYIIKRNGYYLTRIWVIDAYKQLNKAASPQYGTNLYTPTELVKKAIASNNLKNKAIVGFNTSGFYLKGTFDASSVEKYPAYDKTSVGTIIINNGKLVRNSYNKAFKQWYIMGINKQNKMVIFEDNPATNQDSINKKKEWSKTVINSGIRNTFTFAGPIILNGKKLTSFSTSMPDSSNSSPKGLQLMCQINDNNFALFTATSQKRSVAIDVFLSLGCKTAMNLDGGGSVALFYKEKNSQEFKNVLGGARALPEAGYFTE